MSPPARGASAAHSPGTARNRRSVGRPPAFNLSPSRRDIPGEMKTGRIPREKDQGTHWLGIYVTAMADEGQLRPVERQKTGFRQGTAALVGQGEADAERELPYSPAAVLARSA